MMTAIYVFGAYLLLVLILAGWESLVNPPSWEPPSDEEFPPGFTDEFGALWDESEDW